MNLSDLNPEQKNTFLSLAHKIAIVDGKVVPDEVALINEITAVLGSDISVIAEEVYGNARTDLFGDTDSQRLVLKWLFRIAFSDVHFHIDEVSVIDALAKDLGTSDDDVARIREEARLTASG